MSYLTELKIAHPSQYKSRRRRILLTTTAGKRGKNGNLIKLESSFRYKNRFLFLVTIDFIKLIEDLVAAECRSRILFTVSARLSVVSYAAFLRFHVDRS